jgi:enoyl-[acyl-carrier-protein] reductase (NADH)
MPFHLDACARICYGRYVVAKEGISLVRGVLPGPASRTSEVRFVSRRSSTLTADASKTVASHNVISPGSIDTALFGTVSPEFRRQITSAIPLGRLGASEEVASAALFFASADASFVTGANLVVDGGFSHI